MLDRIAADVTEYWYVYLSMPVIAAVIGYGTKLVAIEMMFRPLEFRGVGRRLGWQGIVPRRAARMAAIACDTMTDKLIRPEEIFQRLDAERIAKEIERPLLESVEQLAHEVALRLAPGLWEALPEQARRLVVRRVQAEAPRIVAHIMRQIEADIDSVFDLKDMIVTNLVRDKELLNRIFRESGRKEFQFIARSGIVFGGLIGCLQALAWAVLQNPWVMPVFGLITGWLTDWLALKMIFEPKRPKKYLGLVTWQGLFLRRRREIAGDYGALIAKEILTPHNVINSVLRGPLSDRLFSMVQREVQRVIDRQAGLARPFVVLAVGSTRYQETKRLVGDTIIARLPEAMAYVEHYAEDAMDIRNTLVAKMQELPEEEFEKLLRPAFQQDEWILIAVGAALGFCVGELQVLLVEHLTR